MTLQPKTIKVPSINPNLTLNGVPLTSATVEVQLDVKSNGAASFSIAGILTDEAEIDQFKNYLVDA